jgi:hypothetical protein
VQVRSSPNERTARVLLGRIGLLLRIVAIATALAIARRPGVATAMTTPAKPSHKETLSRNGCNQWPGVSFTAAEHPGHRPDHTVSRPSNKGEHTPSVPPRALRAPRRPAHQLRGLKVVTTRG